MDVVGFLHLGGYFISFMSGNSTKLAVNLAKQDTMAVALLAALLGLFVIGTIVGVLLRHLAPKSHAAFAVLAFVALLLALAALVYEAGLLFPAAALMTLAMGAENATFQRTLGDAPVGVTYMTGALVNIGQRLAHAMLGGPRWTWVPYFALWLGLMTGGVAGAFAFTAYGLKSLWFAACWAAGLSMIAYVIRRRLEG